MQDLRDRNCIIFGSGFIGTNLSLALASKVNKLKVFSRNPYPISPRQQCEYITGNFMDGTVVAKALHGCDTVIHLISGTTPTTSNIDKIYEFNTNVVGSIQLLEACKTAKIKRVIFASSGGAIYGVPKVIPTPEETDMNPINAYGISKLAIEKYLALFEYLNQIEYRILRIANVYGPFFKTTQNHGIIGMLLKNILQKKAIDIWNGNSIIRDYIYTDDVTAAFIQAMRHEGPSRAFNIGSGIGISLQDIIVAIESIVGYEALRNVLPERPIDIPITTLDISKARLELNWEPRVDLLSGLRQTIHWLNNHDE